MPGDQVRAGPITFQTNGEIQECRGKFTYNLGKPKKEPIVGSDGKVHGWKVIPQVAFIEGTITDRGNLDVAALLTMTDTTATLGLPNGKCVVLHDACQVGEGTADSEEAEIPIRYEGRSAEEIS